MTSWTRPSAGATAPLVRFREFIARAGSAVLGLHLSDSAGGAAWASRFATGRPEVLKIAAVSASWRQSLRQENCWTCSSCRTTAAEQALRTGKVALLAEPGPNGAVVYRYDDTNPEGRTARMLADRAIAARRRPHRPGGRHRPA